MADEQIIIVDEHDNIIGHKRRDLVTHDDIYRVAALWLTNSRGQVLLAQRKWTKTKNPGKWGPAVAGTVARGESYDDNMYKEAQEEIGLTGLAFERGHKDFYDTAAGRYFRQWYSAQLDRDEDDFVIQEEEVEQVRWVDPADLAHDVKLHPDKYTAGVAVQLGQHA